MFMFLPCETDTHLKFFVHALYMLECRSAVWVCAQSRDVFITACITKEKWLHAELIVGTCFTWPEWLCAEVLISLFHACMHCGRKGGSAQMLDSASSMHMHTHSIAK
jgi:hypothetical protein